MKKRGFLVSLLFTACALALSLSVVTPAFTQATSTPIPTLTAVPPLA